MIYGSLFSGIEAATVAWKPLGWESAWFSEIDPFPCAVLSHHYPTVENLGDVTKIDWRKQRPVGLIVGGSPCQSFSVAGKRLGLDDPLGNMALVYLAVVARLRPRWFVFENVPGLLSSDSGRDFGTFLGEMVKLGYGFAYRVLDAQYFGVAQRRRRVFVVGYLGDWRPPVAVLTEPESMQGYPAPGREERQEIAGSLGGGTGERGWCNDLDRCGALITGPVTSAGGTDKKHGHGWGQQEWGNGFCVPMAYGGNRLSGPVDVATAVNSHGGPCGRMDFETETFIIRSLRAEGFDASDDGTGRGTPLVATRAVVRRLTPRECERLQGFPDDYTLIEYRGKPASDGPRYKALGNSMAVPVMRWIGARIERYESCHAE